jgi:hypothetical protein
MLSNRNCFKLLVKLRFSDCTVSVIQILDDADAAFRILGAELRIVLSATTMFADKPHRLNGQTSVQRVYVLTIVPPVTALTVGLPAQRAIAQRFSAVARNGPPAMSAVWSLSRGKRTWRLLAPTSVFDPTETWGSSHFELCVAALGPLLSRAFMP